MLEGWFSWFIVLWTVILLGLMSIGGYFMFRKFLKRLPKEDGMSILDWEEHYINKTRHLWDDEQKQLLEELVSPVPELFRDVATSKIAGKIGELAIKENASKITQDLIIQGYIVATPKRDHKFLIKKLQEKRLIIQITNLYLQNNLHFLFPYFRQVTFYTSWLGQKVLTIPIKNTASKTLYFLFYTCTIFTLTSYLFRYKNRLLFPFPSVIS